MAWRNINRSLEGRLSGDDVEISGRVVGVRDHKNILFLDIGDHSGSVQLVIDKRTYDQDGLDQARKGSFVVAKGTLENRGKDSKEIKIESLDVIGRSSLRIQSPWEIDGSDPLFGNVVFSFPEVYVSNPQRAAILKIKTDFVGALHDYFQREEFVLVEPPIITDKTLYGKDNAIEAEVHGERVFLSQCATFELEPLALAFGRVYTISPAFRNEMAGSKRHLAEYTHAKAEALLADIDFLKNLSTESIHHAMKVVLESNDKELSLLGVNPDIEGLEPSKQERMTYNEAIAVARERGSETEWGEGLKRRDEEIITAYCGNKYVWVDFPPFATEGFPYRRLPSDRRLSMTCDLIAPHSAGEMVGVAEKITDPEELVQNLIEKGQGKNISRFWKYIALREYGMPPHGGIGAAPERIIYGLLGLDHIRLTKPWPRYPDRKIVAPKEDLDDYGSDRLAGLIEKYALRG
ncbi:hypothetical protein COU61_02200 [Candidatus Pacearchaeota archaeon CG10_big_fil_rev_8_21_14_0_10_35_13]|nr:MAG: hypothetical protein COU61_02200 [Candidatus Pacearchaeota archaeon CG10_big_fil_rev_8_21_14_0_10_35_13]